MCCSEIRHTWESTGTLLHASHFGNTKKGLPITEHRISLAPSPGLQLAILCTFLEQLYISGLGEERGCPLLLVLENHHA
ncbi:hypothetical protein QQF64_002381 [Cirrhinus molitorella]|uniref:Uncharacterized protein n=2 Tax=Cirrhinus molitorella TaxID=172907 RepID=A0AA88TL94_9TELE|nr:hypothetical protein Q8A67_023766 [Cirrhinus molitorella]